MEEITETKEGDLLTCGSEYILDDAQLKSLVLWPMDAGNLCLLLTRRKWMRSWGGMHSELEYANHGCYRVAERPSSAQKHSNRCDNFLQKQGTGEEIH